MLRRSPIPVIEESTAGPVPRSLGAPSSVPRVRVRVTAVATIGSFIAVLAAIETLALRGQVDFSRHVLHLKGAWLAVPPIALEGGTLAAATLTLWAVLSQDSASLPRLMTAALLSAAAYANYQGAKHANRPTLAADYLAGASVAAYLMWHSILTRIRRAELRDAGAIETPLPRFRLLRWIFASRETYAAYKVAIRQSITRPDEALARLRYEPVSAPAQGGDQMRSEELAALAAERGGKRRVVEYAAATLGTYEPIKAQQWLAARGIEVDQSYISRTLTRMIEDRRRELTAARAEQ